MYTNDSNQSATGIDPTGTLTDNQIYDSFYVSIDSHDVTWRRNKQPPKAPLRLSIQERERRVQLRIKQYGIMGPFRVSPFKTSI